MKKGGICDFIWSTLETKTAREWWKLCISEPPESLKSLIPLYSIVLATSLLLFGPNIPADGIRIIARLCVCGISAHHYWKLPEVNQDSCLGPTHMWCQWREWKNFRGGGEGEGSCHDCHNKAYNTLHLRLECKYSNEVSMRRKGTWKKDISLLKTKDYYKLWIIIMQKP